MEERINFFPKKGGHRGFCQDMPELYHGHMPG